LEGSVKPELRELRLQFEEFADATVSTRKAGEKARDYRDGNQWTDDEREVLRKRKQPCITDNKIQDKCDALLGMEKQLRTDPKAYPRTPAHTEAAEVATDALRYVADDSQFSETSAAAADNLMVEGLCAGEVIVEPKKGSYARVRMNHIRWDRVFYDPRSLRLDYQDSEYKGFFTWMDVDKAKSMPQWKGKEDVLEQSFAEASSSEAGPDKTLDDKPRFTITVRQRKRVQIFTHYFRQDAKWMRAVWCKGGFLEEPKESNYKDEFGEPDCCIEFQAVYKDRDGNPYGIVQRYLDLQDEINKRRSKMLHLLNTKQIKMDKGAVEDVNVARTEAHKPDGVIEVTPGTEFEILTNMELAQGQWQLLQETTNALSLTGPNAALLGQTGSVSGRAKQLDQQAGTLTVTPLFEALRSFKLRMYRHAWNRVRQYWNAEMWIRVTDDEDKVRFVGLNQPVLQGDVLAEQLKSHPASVEEKQAMLQQVAADPQSKVPVLDEQGQPKLKNSVAEMDVDIIIDESPDTVNIQQEQFDSLVELAKLRPDVPLDLLIEASQLRSEIKKKIQDKMTGQNDPAAQQQAQFAQMMQKLDLMLKQGEAAKQQAEVRDINASAAQKEQGAVESHIDAAVKTAEFIQGDASAAKTSVSVS
jgi:hypothetical protein